MRSSHAMCGVVSLTDASDSWEHQMYGHTPIIDALMQMLVFHASDYGRNPGIPFLLQSA